MTYILRSPLIRSDHNTFNDLNTSQTTLLTSGLQVLEYSVVKLLVLAHVFKVVRLAAILGCKSLESRLVRNDDSNWLVLALVSVDADVGDNIASAVD